MSRTADTSYWNTESEYHENRAAHVEPQVEGHLLPFFNEFASSSQPLKFCDFACGHGAIASQLSTRLQEDGRMVEDVLLIDTVEENIVAAKQKFGPGDAKPRGFVTNGNNFEGFDGPKVDLFYTWDAMVHFDIIDVVGYVSTVSSICDGYCFFHHSKYGTITSDIRNNPHWRNFMTQDTFAQICTSAGLEVIRQTPMLWGEDELDCITIARVG